MTDINDYNLIYEYNGRRVGEIDTSLVGTYKIYATTKVDGKDVTQLVYTLNIEEGYVEVKEIENNYTVMIILIIGFVLIIAAGIYIQKKKRII